MNAGEEGALQDVRGTAAPNALTPDGRFSFDGERWHAVPLAPEVTKRRRRMPGVLVWILVVIAAVVGAAILFEIFVTVGLIATHQVPG